LGSSPSAPLPHLSDKYFRMEGTLVEAWAARHALAM
jgi:hypothetical protein